jgi:hypothetical protein
MTTFSDNSSIDHQIANVYKQAADLFDSNTVLDIEKDEYARGVAELVTRLLGMDSGDVADVAKIISEKTGAYRVTRADFGTGLNGDALYIGPLNVAMEFIKRTCVWEVKACNSGKSVLVELDGGNCFGADPSAEMAWRYAIAAELYGNSGDTFEPFFLK